LFKIDKTANNFRSGKHQLTNSIARGY